MHAEDGAPEDFLFLGDDHTGEYLAQTFTPQVLVDAMRDIAKMLNRYRVYAFDGLINVTCSECTTADQFGRGLIWSSRHKARKEWSLLRLTNIVHEHEHIFHAPTGGGSNDGASADNTKTRFDV